MSQKSRVRTLALLLSGLLCTALAYAGPGADAGHASHWPDNWATTQEPFRIFGDSYSCEGGKLCASIFYADSIDPVSFADFTFTPNDSYPNVTQDLEGSFATLSKLPCDILISVHPEFSGMWAKLARTTSEKNGFFIPRACRKYVGIFKESLRKRIAAEHS